MKHVISAILSTVAAVTRTTVAMIRSARKWGELVRARHVAAWILRHGLGLSYPDIAAILGGKDHSSIMYAVRRVEADLRDDRGWIPDVVVDVIGRMAVAA